jgi:hypothetical protein
VRLLKPTENSGGRERVGGVWNAGKPERAVWSGFARGEILSWWMNKGCIPVDVPAVRFAERSREKKAGWFRRRAARYGDPGGCGIPLEIRRRF